MSNIIEININQSEMERIEKEFTLALQYNDELVGIKSRLNDNWVTLNEFANWTMNEKNEQLLEFISNYESDCIHEDLLTSLGKIDEQNIALRVSSLSLLENELMNNVNLKIENENLSRATSKLEVAQNNMNSHQLYFDWLKVTVSKTKSLKNDWDKKIADQLNGPIQTVYRRLNRHSNFYDIDFKREGRTSQLANIGVQAKGKTLGVANVLSAGQLSTVALSVFFTVSFSQWQSTFRCYFMDDPIQSMDDLNILSFVDLLRTELGPQRPYEKRFADQLFVTTCNEDLENLIAYKMNNFGVNIHHVKLKGYGISV